MSKYKLVLWTLVLVTPLLVIARINIKETQAAWSPTHGAWMRRQMLNVVNSSTVTLHTNTTVAVTVDTKTLVGQGRLKSDCSDIRVLYQPNSSTNTELTRHLVFPGGGNCGTSTATKVYFSLQADITTTDTTNDYYIYFDNPQASTPANTDNAFDIGAKDALLVCPFEGSTTCAAGETPSTATGALRYSAGKSAMSFDGKDDYVSLPQSAITSGNITYSLWFNSKNVSSNSQTNLLSFMGTLLRINSTGVRWFPNVDTTVVDVAATINNDTWNHIAVSQSGTSYNIFLNGTSLGSGTTVALHTDTHTYAIANYAGVINFAGLMDEVVIYDRALSSSEISYLYNSGKGKIVTRDAYTKLLYHMDENGDDPRNTGKVIDDSGNANHGTITGAKYAGGIVGIDNPQVLSSSTGLMDQAYASHNGIFVEEGTTNKITNPSFENDTYNTNWTATTGTLSLQDEFITARSAGAVNGTAAEAGPGNRTVTDTTSKLSITNGKLSISGSNTTWGDPGIWYPSISRSAGKIFIGKINQNAINTKLAIGFDDDTATLLRTNAIAFHETGNIYFNENTSQSLGSYSAATDYLVAVVLRNTGAYYYIKGGIYTTWTLLWISAYSNTATLFPGIANYTAAFTSDFIRIPTSTFLPTPLAYDTFTRGDGAIGNSETTGPDAQVSPSLAWTGGAISSNKNVITPTLGSDMFDAGAGTFESGTYSWTPSGTNTVQNDSNTLKTTYVDNAIGSTISWSAAGDLNSNLTVGQWYQVGFDAKVNAGSSVNIYVAPPGGGVDNKQIITETDFTSKRATFLASHATANYFRSESMGAGEIIWLDNLTFKPLTLSSLFSSVTTSDKDVIASADIVAGDGTQAGIATNLNSADSPTAGLVAYYDHQRNSVDLVKFTTATGWTGIQSTYTTYSAGATLRVITYHSDASTLKVRVYYNNALVGTEQTVTDAAIISNTIHGLFSTYSGNTFDNFTLFARGSDGEYAIPGEYDGTITVTEETSAPYVKFGSSSMKAVSTYDGTVTTNINPGNTNTHTLSAYVYDGTTGNVGGTVSSSIASLVFNSAPVTTTYTDMGGGWWRLTYSAAGVNASGNYGVEVMSGKTVYIDGVQLEEKAYATTYADGTLGNGYAWTSTVNDSTSTRTASLLNYATSNNLLGTGNGTISFWAKLPSVQTTSQYLVLSTGTSSTNIKIQNDAPNNRIIYSWGSDNNTVSYTPTINNWYHFVLTQDGTGPKLYINNSANTGTKGTTITGLSATMYINQWAGNSPGNWITSDLRIYDSVLTADEVSDLYYSGLLSKSDTYATVTVDNFQDSTVLGATTTNKITNPSFENSTFNTNWTQTQEYTLQDEFTDTVAAGSVNGTTSTPGGQTRTVTDTGSDMGITDGKLSVIEDDTTTYGDPGIWYPAVTRTPGKTLFWTYNLTTGWWYHGFDNNTSLQGVEASYYSSGATLCAMNNFDSCNKNVATLSTSTDYILAVVLRSTGAYYYIKGGTYSSWTLLYIGDLGSSSNLYPMQGSSAYGGYKFTGSVDNIRIPTSTFLPTPLAYDTFTTAGSSTTETTGPDSQTTPSLTWTNGTKSGGTMSISPLLGNEMWEADASTFESGIYSWYTPYSGTNTLENVNNSLQVTYGSGGYGAGTTLRESGDLLSDLTVGGWYQLQFDAWVNAGSNVGHYINFGNGDKIIGENITSTTPVTKLTNFRSFSATSSVLFNSNFGTGEKTYWDNLSLKPFTLSSLFSTVPTNDKDVIASTDITSTASTQAGIATNINSASSPTAGIVAYLTRTNNTTSATVTLDKFTTATTWTSLINTAVTYSAGATLRVVTYHSDASTLKVRVYYNNNLIDSEKTVTDAAIRDNTIHGLFSTYSGNTFDNFSLFARGSDGEYSTMPDDPSTHLTAEENTTNTYNKSGGKSVKLTNTNASYPFEYVTAINPGNTNTHTLSAYVYNGTTGSVGGKIDSSVAKLVFNGSVVTPSSYTQVDGNWWRLSYSASTTNAAGDFGVEVQAGKTVYMDSVQLEEGSSATSYVDGSLGRGYEWTSTANNSTSTRLGGEGKGQAPVGAWHFDEGYGTTANDSSINLNALTISGATWSSTSGNGGKYLTFDGTDDYLSRSFDTDFDFGTDPFTISGFFRSPSTGSGQRTILARQSGSVGYKVYMDSSGYICFSVNSDSACTTTSYADSKWHTFSGVRGSENIKLFIDGDEKALTNQSSPATVNGANSLYIGIDTDGASNPWTGDLDELTIYPYARTATQLLTDNLGNENTTLLASSIYDPLTQGLVGWWKMDETSGTLTDSSGNGYTGTWSGTGASHYTTGKYANGGGFNGTDDTVTLPNNIISSAQGSVSMWVKTSQNVTSTYAMLFYGSANAGNGGGSENELHLHLLNDEKIQFYIEGGTSDVTITSTNSYADNAWHLVQATWDINSSANLYIDGTMVGTATHDANNFNFSHTTALGKPALATRYYQGTLDDVRIYNRALDSNEVMSLYKYAPGPVAHYKFNEGAGQSIIDSSGNNINGTLGINSGVSTDDPVWTDGKYGKALEYNGDTTYSLISANSNLALGYGNYTYEFWINPYTSSPGILTNNGSNKGTTIYFTSNCVVSNIGGVGDTNCTPTIAYNTWQHYALVLDRATGLTVYRNGQNVGTNTNFTSLLGTNLTDGNVYNTTIGIYSTRKLNGKMDDLKLYNYARTQEQVVSDMNATHPAPGSPVGSAVAHYKFDEGYGTVANNSGSGGSSLNGTLTNMSSPATSTSGWANNGKFGKGLVFDGSDDYVNLTDINAVDGQSAISYSVWFKPTALVNWKQIIGKENSSSDRWSLSLSSSGYGDNNDLFITMGNGANTYGYTTGDYISPNTWYHVQVVYDGTQSDNASKLKIFINGIQRTLTFSGTIPSTTPSNSATVKIGAYITGSIDEVKIYNFALTADQIKAEYNKGAALVLGSNTDSGKVIASDSFNKGSMGTTEVGNYTWSGSTWSTANGKAVNTPVIGGDLVTNGTFDTDTWWTRQTGWTISGGTANHTGSSDLIFYTPLVTVGAWYKSTFDIASGTGDTYPRYGNTWDGRRRTGIGSYIDTGRASGNTGFYIQGVNTVSIDNYTLKPLTLASLFSTVSTSSKDVISSIDIILTSGTQAGLITNLNSASTPTAGLIAYHDGTSIKLDKFTTATTWTNLIKTAATYVAGATLQVVTYHSDPNTLKVKVYYNGTQVGTEQTITDTAIINNTVHGMFSTYSGNTLDNFTLKSNAVDYTYCVPGSTDTCLPPVAEWNFDEGQGQYANDTAGNSNTGTLGSGATADSADPSWTQGKAGKGLKFDGVDDQIDLGDPVSGILDFGTSDFTINMWLYFDGTANSEGFIAKYGTPGFRIYVNSGTSLSHLLIKSDGSSVGSTTTIALTANTWTHFAFVFDRDGYLYTYQNGRIIDQDDISSANESISNSASLTIGKAPTRYLHGKIDTVQLYNYARTPSQIAWDYNRGKALIHLKFDEESGSVAYDSSGNGTNGTITGATVSTSGKLNNALSFDGTDDFISVTSTASVNAVSFWMKQTNTSDKSIIDLGGGYTVTLASNAITTAGFSSPTVYVDGKVSTAVSDTNWHFVTVTTATSFALSNPTIGKVSTNFFTGLLDDVKIFNYPLTATQVIDLYNSGAIKFDK